MTDEQELATFYSELANGGKLNQRALCHIRALNTQIKQLSDALVRIHHRCEVFADAESDMRLPSVEVMRDIAARAIGLPEAVRQYYYRSDACKVDDTKDPECKCWHDEGTGPLFNNPMTTIQPKTWRIKPAAPHAGETSNDN